MSAHLIAEIPFNCGTNNVTHGDYEGVGVQPDVRAPADKALLTAHILALRGVLARIMDDAQRKADLEKLIAELKTKLKDGNVTE